LLGFDSYEQLKNAHFKWIDSVIQSENNNREAKWSQSIAVGSEAYINKIKEALDFRARGRKIRQAGDAFELRETLKPYGSDDFFEADNTLLWDR
jgi:putative transposase